LKLCAGDFFLTLSLGKKLSRLYIYDLLAVSEQVAHVCVCIYRTFSILKTQGIQPVVIRTDS